MLNFFYPRAFLLLLVFPLFLYLEIKYHAWQNRQQKVFAESPLHDLLHLRAPRRPWRTLTVWFGIWTALVLALARPVWLSPGVSPGSSRDFSLYVLLDTSLSMQAEDLPPSRLRAAKKFILQLAQSLPAAPVGLIVFAGEAQMACPPTRDHWALGQALENIRAHALAHKGTQLESALDLALAKISRRPADRPAAVVVVSDGEMNQPGDPMAAAALLAAEKIPIFCIGTGTPEGTGIPLGKDFWGKPLYRVHQGLRVVTRLDPALLKRLALVGAGTYATLQDGVESPVAHLNQALSQHPWLLSSPYRSRQRQHNGNAGQELYPWGLALAGLIWLAGRLQGRRRP